MNGLQVCDGLLSAKALPEVIWRSPWDYLHTGGVLTDDMLAAYLARIAAPRPLALDAAALRDLHRAHLMAAPFENLRIHLGEPISLDEADLIDKIVARRRGGFCYELNGAFAYLLERLGARVRRVAARVYGEGGSHSTCHCWLTPGRPGRPGRAVPAHATPEPAAR